MVRYADEAKCLKKLYSEKWYIYIIEIYFLMQFLLHRLALKATNNNLIDSITKIEFSDQSERKQNDNDEPECTYEEFKSAMSSNSPELSESNISESYMKKLYANFLKQKGKGLGAGITLAYNWADNSEDGYVYVYVAIKPQTKKNQIKSVLTSNKWKLEVDDMGTIIDGDLFEKIVPDESWWSIESAGVLCMALQKSVTSGELWTVSVLDMYHVY